MFHQNKIRNEETNCFRNGYITRHLTSLDIEELVRVGSVILKFYERFICDNLQFNPFENFVNKMTEKGNKFKKEKKVFLQTLTKKTNKRCLWILHKS